MIQQIHALPRNASSCPVAPRAHYNRNILAASNRVAIDDPGAWCVCTSVTRLRSAKMAERIKVPCVVETLGAHCNRWGPDPLRRRKGSSFDAVVAKLLWPQVLFHVAGDTSLNHCNILVLTVPMLHLFYNFIFIGPKMFCHHCHVYM